MRYLVLLFCILLAGCNAEVSGDFLQVDHAVKGGGSIDTYFCPRDSCGEKIEEKIKNASESVHCAFFDLDLKDMIDALEQKSREIDVKLIVDTDNHEFVSHLNNVRQDNRSGFMHNKFCVIDEKITLTGSMNPTKNGDEKNNNNILFLESSQIAKNYEKEFLEMWTGEFGKGKKTENPLVYIGDIRVENYFCPEDRCSGKIERTLKEAEESIYFMTFSFTHDFIANELLMKSLKEVDIHGIFENRGAGSEYSKHKVFDYQGLDVIKDKNPAAMHHKVFIIDEKITITGSMNPSNNADFRNDENVLIIYSEEIAERYIDEFERIKAVKDRDE